MEQKYYYPDNLIAQPVFLVWIPRDLIVIGISALFGFIIWLTSGLLIPFLFCAVYAFFTVRTGDIFIYEYMIRLFKFAVTDHTIFRWSME